MNIIYIVQGFYKDETQKGTFSKWRKWKHYILPWDPSLCTWLYQ